MGGQHIGSPLNVLVGAGVGSNLLFLVAYIVAGGEVSIQGVRLSLHTHLHTKGGKHISIQGPNGVSLWRYVGAVGVGGLMMVGWGWVVWGCGGGEVPDITGGVWWVVGGGVQ